MMKSLFGIFIVLTSSAHAIVLSFSGEVLDSTLAPMGTAFEVMVEYSPLDGDPGAQGAYAATDLYFTLGGSLAQQTLSGNNQSILLNDASGIDEFSLNLEFSYNGSVQTSRLEFVFNDQDATAFSSDALSELIGVEIGDFNPDLFYIANGNGVITLDGAESRADATTLSAVPEPSSFAWILGFSVITYRLFRRPHAA